MKKKKKYALISVSDKTRVSEIAKCLADLNYGIISTSGTAKALEADGIPVVQVSEITGFPEIFEGRVKTLHPKIHGGILGRRDHPGDIKQAEENGLHWIEVVIVNLYPFEKVVIGKNVPIKEAIENIDIGGPAIVRAAAKNYQHVTVIVDPKDYKTVLEEINIKGQASLKTRERLAVKAFSHTAIYDSRINTYLSKSLLDVQTLHLHYREGVNLRYGENDHQTAIFLQGGKIRPLLFPALSSFMARHFLSIIL